MTADPLQAERGGLRKLPTSVSAVSEAPRRNGPVLRSAGGAERFRYSHLKEAAAFAADAVPTMGIESLAPKNFRSDCFACGSEGRSLQDALDCTACREWCWKWQCDENSPSEIAGRHTCSERYLAQRE